MRKMPTLFIRDFSLDCPATPEVNPEAAWVLNGEGQPFQKLDGTSVLITNGRAFKRYDAKDGKRPPDSFSPCYPEPIGRHWPGWLPVGEGPEDQWLREALSNWDGLGGEPPEGTYELCGPKIQGNPERRPCHCLVPHRHVDSQIFGDVPREYHTLKVWLAERDIEGIVWHHPDGRMAKIKKRDFGLPRKPSRLEKLKKLKEPPYRR